TAVLESTPPLPHRLKASVNPALSNLIMKALAKSPDERFQSGQELVRELEQCKSAAAAAKATPAVSVKAASVTRIKAPVREAPKANAAAAGLGVQTTSATNPVAPKVTASAAPAVAP